MHHILDERFGYNGYDVIRTRFCAKSYQTLLLLLWVERLGMRPILLSSLPLSSLSHLCFKPPPSSSALCFSFTFFILPPILLPLFHLTKLQSEALFNGSPPSLSLSPSSLSPSFSSLSPQVTDHMATAADLHETITRFTRRSSPLVGAAAGYETM